MIKFSLREENKKSSYHFVRSYFRMSKNRNVII